MNTNKNLIISVSVSLLCVAIGLTCAFLLDFDLVSIIIFAAVVAIAIVINVFCWKEIVKNKENGKNK